MMALPRSLYLKVSTKQPALHRIRISLLSWLYPQKLRAPHENDRVGKTRAHVGGSGCVMGWMPELGRGGVAGGTSRGWPVDERVHLGV